MKKINYSGLVQKIRTRANDLEILRIAKEQEKRKSLVPHKVNSKTIVFSPKSSLC